MKKNIVNVTPHLIRFVSSEDGSVYEVAPYGKLVNAEAQEQVVRNLADGSEIVKVTFAHDPASFAVLAEIESQVPDAIVIGSMVAAQAYPEKVFAMISAPGFERVSTEEKRMRDDKFTTF